MPKGVPKNGINKGWFKKGVSIRKGVPVSKETREKMRQAKLGKPAPMKGRERPDMKGKKHWFYGGMPEQVKNKIKETYKNKDTSGEKSPSWKGGVSRAYKTGYYSKEYKEWRKKVFERDGYTCQECGIKECYITAHHIKSFAYYPELRFDIKNGKTLCEDCHKLTDNYKGRAKTLNKLTNNK